MSAASARCASCSAGVPDEDLESGAAILLLGKAFCPSCKGAAVRNVSLDDLSTPGPDTSERSPVRSAPPPPQPRERVEPTARPVPHRPPRRHGAPSKLPIALAIGGLAVLAVAGVALALRGGGAPPPRKDPKPGDPPVSVTPTPAPADPEAAARQAFADVEPLLRRGDVEPDQILAAIEAARPACRGTPFAARLDEARARVLSDRDKLEAVRKFDPLFDTLKKAVAEDADFRRYMEIHAKFQEARELAGRASPSAVSSVQILQQDYTGRYEKEAEPHYQNIQGAAQQLASEKRHDDALKFIDTFPKHLRGSGAWRGLEKLREQIERDKRFTPKK